MPCMMLSSGNSSISFLCSLSISITSVIIKQRQPIALAEKPSLTSRVTESLENPEI